MHFSCGDFPGLWCIDDIFFIGQPNIIRRPTTTLLKNIDGVIAVDR
jgi:hypothetical protein